MAIFSTSTLWPALRRLSPLRLAAGLLIAILCTEAVARVAPLVVPKTVRQPFTVLTMAGEETGRGEPGSQVEWRTNEVGARGSFQRPGLAIAAFGTSTTAGAGITQADTFPEVLGARLCGASVDNFARDAAGWSEALVIMEDLARRGRHYDAAIIMAHIGGRSAGHIKPFHAWSDFSAGGGPLAAPVLFKQALRREFHETGKRAPLIATLLAEVRKIRNPPLQGFHHPSPLDENNRALRASSAVQFADSEAHLDEAQRAVIVRRTQSLVEDARQIASHVIVLTQPVAYDEDALPGVAARWLSLYPLAKDRPLYISNRSVAEGIRLGQSVVAEAAAAAGATVVPLDAAMRPMLAETDRLFFDKWHFTAEGHRTAAKIIAPYLCAALVGEGGCSCSGAT
ncbi:GDSL-type esterase/lipase family protein [Acuticoccus sp. I52.16.1]|uniref:GDSL-type esterase/lipase family protein n=1 Tax=Acuticoccus sp. I52.16.1 TaxID=2928472 RepID=UPI001FD5DB40|nr:GDSL-type esterase/lipase family protein [Acuticoccus sp. I52.16.1]UOM36771.1 GDSL-type esterase/lipase family protein [Acuticoccus sp. I52.16.1]